MLADAEDVEPDLVGELDLLEQVAQPLSPGRAPARPVRPAAPRTCRCPAPLEAIKTRVRGMWDVLEWHNGTLSVAWWAVILVVFVLIALAGALGRSK